MAGVKPQRVGTIFYGGSWPLKAPSKDFHLAIGGGLGWMKWLKNGTEKGYSCNVYFLVKIYWLMAKLKKL